MGDFNIDLLKHDTNADCTVVFRLTNLHQNPNTGYNTLKNTH